MEDHNPYSAPSAVAEPVAVEKKGVSAALRKALHTHLAQASVLLPVILIVWLPIELVDSYLEYHVFGEEETGRSFRVSMLLDFFFGSIARIGVISVGISVASASTPSVSRAFSTVGRCYGSMLGARFLSNLIVLFALLLFVLPGLYVMVRMSFVESIVVAERTSAREAIRRSFEITKDRFWYSTVLWIVTLPVLFFLAIVLFLPLLFFPALDTWLIATAIYLVIDFITVFMTLSFYFGYRDLVSEELP